MEISSISGLNELEMEEPSFIDQWAMNSADELSALSLIGAYGENMLQSLAHPSFNTLKNSIDASHPTTIVRPTKQLKPNGFISSKSTGDHHHHHLPTPQASSFSPDILSFADSNNQMEIMKPKEEALYYSESFNTIPYGMPASHQGSLVNQNHGFKACHGPKRTTTNGSRYSHTQDHIIAERKRREKLSQRFIALSAIVPGLKKTDKASVLGDAIKYLKQMQERVKTLEEQTNKKAMESVAIVKKSKILLCDDDNSSSDESFSKGPVDEPLPEIEVRICDKHVLIRIHCEKRKGILEKTIAEVEKLHLSVINSSVLTFGTYTLDITIIAQMDSEFVMSVQDLVKNLHSAFKLFM